MHTHDRAERRRWERLPIRAGVAIVRVGSGRSLPGRTLDASAGGLLLELSASGVARPSVGDRVRVGVAWHDEPVLRADRLAEARVVRVLERVGGVCWIGVEFEGVSTGEARAAA